MALLNLDISGFRNLSSVRISLAPGENYFFGPNAAGKTSILEAVYYLAIGRSFRRARDNDMRGFDAEVMRVAGVDDAGNEAEIRTDGQEKRIELNGRALDRLSAYLGWLPVVALLLDDIDLVRGAPSQRRGYFDFAIAKADRAYLSELARYRHVLAQRNRVLTRNGTEETHVLWEGELARAALPVMERRSQVVERLLASAAEYSRQLGGDPVEFVYRPSVPFGDDAAERLVAKLAETRGRSVELGHTVVGPHRDDFSARSSGRSLRRFGSVGEQRLAAIALRLAEAKLLAGVTGREPVLLLDEVASELDSDRGAGVLQLVREHGQVLYAAARPFTTEGKVFHVEAGKVQEVH